MCGTKWRSARTWKFFRFLSLRNNMMQTKYADPTQLHMADH